MSRENQIADRLARGVREAKKTARPQSPEAGSTSAQPARAAPSAPAPRKPARNQPASSGQSPSSTLDRPWENLHPARIWPD